MKISINQQLKHLKKLNRLDDIKSGLVNHHRIYKNRKKYNRKQKHNIKYE